MHLTIRCKHCGIADAYEIDQAIEQQLDRERGVLIDQLKTKWEEQHGQELAEAIKQTREQVERAAKEQTRLQYEDLQARLALQESLLEQRDEQLKQHRNVESELRLERDKIEASRLELELTVQRRLDEERKKLQMEEQARYEQKYRLERASQDKLISDLNKQITDLQRKAEQVNPQRQGEMAEVDLKDQLEAAFGDHDSIERVAKGNRGGDLIHKVNHLNGQPHCTLLWERKNCQKWEKGWLDKARQDQQEAGADLVVIVSKAPPDGAVGHWQKLDGVYVTSPEFAVDLAVALRDSAIKSALERQHLVGQLKKESRLFAYVTSTEFDLQVKETFASQMRSRELIAGGRKKVLDVFTKLDQELTRQHDLVGQFAAQIDGITGEQGPQGTDYQDGDQSYN